MELPVSTQATLYCPAGCGAGFGIRAPLTWHWGLLGPEDVALTVEVGEWEGLEELKVHLAQHAVEPVEGQQ